MGSPLGPTLANIFRCYHETTGLKTARNLSNQCIINDTLMTFLCCLKNRNKFVNYINKDTKILNFRSKLKKITPFLFLMLRFVEKKVNLQQVFSEKIRSVVYTLILVVL